MRRKSAHGLFRTARAAALLQLSTRIGKSAGERNSRKRVATASLSGHGTGHPAQYGTSGAVRSNIFLSGSSLSRVQKGASQVKLRAQKGNGGHITSYNVTIGSREAREAGLPNPDGTSKPVKKAVDAEHHRIIIELDVTQEQADTSAG